MTITMSQLQIIQSEINDNIDLKAKLNNLLEEVRKTVSFEIHDTNKSMTKTLAADTELHKDYETLDTAPWTQDYITLNTLDMLKNIVNQAIAIEDSKEY